MHIYVCVCVCVCVAGTYNALAYEMRVVRLQTNVRMRSVRSNVHGIRTDTVEAGREA